ncbi:MAG: 3-methyl-2-oxobutanoate hydroxymethyltransferase [Candidatus Aquicultorales bacterium]
MKNRVTTESLRRMRREGEPITVLTAYDYPTARLLDEAGIDILLVGDSLGNVVLGYETTLPVTMDDMLHHTKAVARGTQRALVVSDMPFLSYQSSVQKAIENAGAFLKTAGAHAVKLEGGAEVSATVRRIVEAGIPVMGHLGLTPQSVHQLGGFRLQAKEAAAAIKLVEDAQALQEAGAFSVVLEKIPSELARLVGERIEIPTIGIGAGPHCSGQVLVTNDILGLYSEFAPKFVKKYADLSGIIKKAVMEYSSEVKSGAFPAAEHSFEMDESVLDEVRLNLESER